MVPSLPYAGLCYHPGVMNDLLSQLFTLSIFHFIGGLALGWGLRQVAGRRWNAKTPYLLLLGCGFGLAPLFLGASTFLTSRAGYLFFVEAAVLIGAMAVPAFAPLEYLAIFSSPPVVVTILGAATICAGAATIIVNAQRDLQGGLTAGGLLVLIGFCLCGSGLWQVLRGR